MNRPLSMPQKCPPACSSQAALVSTKPESKSALWARAGMAGPMALGALLLSTLSIACSSTPEPPLGSGGAPGSGGAGSGGVTPGTGAVTGSGGGSAGGAPGTGASPGTGGVAPGTGASPGVGGSSPGVGGGSPTMLPDDGSLTDVTTLTPTTCTINISKSELSEKIGSVGIIEFSTDLAGLDGAFIQFGKTTDYVYQAPVDLAEPNMRTLLLGMATLSDYHYKVFATAAGSYCASEDQIITTGPLPNGSEIGNVEGITMGQSSEPVEPGFLVTGNYNGGWMFILNHEGELVWFYKAQFSDITRTHLSYDGKYVWARDGNPGGNANQGSMIRVSIDGLEEQQFSDPSTHHDFTVLPDNSIAYIKAEGGCDRIYRRPGDAADGSGDTLVYDVADAFSSPAGAMGCHCNSIHYHQADDSYTVSALNRNSYVKFGASGELHWVLGRDDSTFTGNGSDWDRQHGHHLLSDTQLLLFNNTNTQTSRVMDVTLDHGAGVATLTDTYESNGAGTTFMGDVQRLPGGNTLVTYSAQGMIHEVDPAGTLIRIIDPPGGPVGYTEHRPSLYGPPPY